MKEKPNDILFYILVHLIFIILTGLSIYSMFYSPWRIGTGTRLIITVITGIILLSIGIYRFLRKNHDRQSKNSKIKKYSKQSK